MKLILYVVIMESYMTTYNNLVDLSNIINLSGGMPLKTVYPPITDDNFQNKIAKIYDRYKITRLPTFKEICFPEKFTYQLPQLFVSEFINPNTPYKGLLLFHKIGAGKTCAAIQIAEQWKHKKKIVFVCPASLIGNIYKELRSDCADNEYISEKEKKLLCGYAPDSDEYANLLNKIKKRIDKHYTIMSYNKFVDLSNRRKLSLKNSLLIIDEVQNIVSEHGSYYQTFLNEIKNAPNNMRVVVMSATPIFDKPIELALTINLLRINDDEMMPINPKFNEMFLKQKRVGDHMAYDIKNVFKLRKLLADIYRFTRVHQNMCFLKK